MSEVVSTGVPLFDKLEVIKTGSLDLNITHSSNIVSAGTQTRTLTHNLGFKPLVIAYASLPNGASLEDNLIQLPYATFFQGGSPQGEVIASTYFDINSDNSIDFVVTHQLNTDYSPLVPIWTVQYYLLRARSNA